MDFTIGGLGMIVIAVESKMSYVIDNKKKFIVYPLINKDDYIMFVNTTGALIHKEIKKLRGLL